MPKTLIITETQIIISDTGKTVVLNMMLNMMLPKLREALGDSNVVIPISGFFALQRQLHGYQNYISQANEAIDSLQQANRSFKAAVQKKEESNSAIRKSLDACEEQFKSQIQITDEQKAINRKNKFLWGFGGGGIGAFIATTLIAIFK